MIYTTGHNILYRYQNSFHGVNLTSLQDVALKEYFHQPVVVSAESCSSVL